MTMIDRSDIERRFFMVRSEPSTGSPFGYSILLPRDARQHPPDQQAGTAFVTLARFRGHGERRFEIRVSALPLFRDIDAGDFIENSALAAGHRVIQRRDWEDTNGCCAEIFTGFDEAGTPHVRRVRAVKEGNLVYAVEGTAAAGSFSLIAHDCAFSLLSFRLGRAEGRYCAENLTWASAAGPVAIRFQHPASWVPSWTSPDASCLECRLSHGGVSAITVQAVTGGKAVDGVSMIRRFASRLKQDGFHLAGAPVTPASASTGPPSLQWTTTGTKAGRAITVGARAIETEAAVMLAAAVMPRRCTDPWSWAVTRRAFTLVSGSVMFTP